MLTWLTHMVHPDGEIAFFNDTALNMSPNLSALTKYASELGIKGDYKVFNGATHLKDSGYGVVSTQNFRLICDIGSIGPDYMPSHGHADTLSFELSVHNNRVFVNSGISIYGESKGRLEQRKTKAHNTVEVDHTDSSEVWSGFRVARRAYPKNVFVGGHTIRASHDGYQRLKGNVIHTREWNVFDERIEIIDELTGSFKIATAFYHMHPQIKAVRKDTNIYRLEHTNGESYEYRITGGGISKLIDSYWYPEFGKRIANQTLHIDIIDRELVASIIVL